MTGRKYPEIDGLSAGVCFDIVRIPGAAEASIGALIVNGFDNDTPAKTMGLPEIIQASLLEAREACLRNNCAVDATADHSQEGVSKTVFQCRDSGCFLACAQTAVLRSTLGAADRLQALGVNVSERVPTQQAIRPAKLPIDYTDIEVDFEDEGCNSQNGRDSDILLILNIMRRALLTYPCLDMGLRFEDLKDIVMEQNLLSKQKRFELLNSLKNSSYIRVVIQDLSLQPAGFMFAEKTDLETAILTGLFVDPIYAGKGYYNTLMEYFFSWAKGLQCEAFVVNHPETIAFYRNYGFRVPRDNNNIYATNPPLSKIDNSARVAPLIKMVREK